MTRYDIVIVGAGHAGAQAAIALRQQKFEGTIAIIGEEPELPYERPPLSKDYLSGEKSWERLLIRPESFWPDRRIALTLGERVERIDPTGRNVTTRTGATIGYGTLIWAAGGTPRLLPCTGHHVAGVHTVRTRADADRMRDELSGVHRAVVIGGGYIGLEAAAVLRKLGKRVVLIEALDRLLARVAGEPLSRFFEEEHRAHGVEIRLNAQVDRILGNEAVTGVQLADGEVIDCELVIVGIGIIPNAAPLLAAGIAGGNGVSVDAQCRTSDARIFAIGDCALHANRFTDGPPIRLESVQNANDQATVAAKAIMDQPAVYDSVPWFWSNQYDLKLQTVGIAAGHDTTLVRGDPATRSFSVIYLKDGRVVALDCVNATRDYVQGRKLVTERALIAPDLLTDDAIPLKTM